MNQWNNEELHKRQEDGDVGLWAIDPPVRWKNLLVPAVVVLLGVILAVVGPVPGLGVFMVLGGAMAVVITALMTWLGG